MMKYNSKLYISIYGYIHDQFYDLELFKREHCFYDFEDRKKRTIFRYFKKCHWDVNTTNIFLKEYNDSPILVFVDNSPYNLLNSYFEDLWVPVFKEWFQDMYNLEVKTIDKL
jgi:hypothetical protein